MSERIGISRLGAVAIVSLQRPDKHNALDRGMIEALTSAGQSLAVDASVRAVVLEGAGPSFCAGIDLGLFQQDGGIDAALMAPQASSPANFFQRAAYIWREVPVPVICALHGSVFGAGLQIALGADLRFATPDCRLSIMEIKWGIIPDMAISKTLPALMPTDRIKELAMTGRVVSGTEAAALGLVTALHADPSKAARDTAGLIAGRSPDAIRAMKKLFDKATSLGTAEALRLEAELQCALLGSSNQSEAVRANLENRRPDFEDPPVV